MQHCFLSWSEQWYWNAWVCSCSLTWCCVGFVVGDLFWHSLSDASLLLSSCGVRWRCNVANDVLLVLLHMLLVASAWKWMVCRRPVCPTLVWSRMDVWWTVENYVLAEIGKAWDLGKAAYWQMRQKQLLKWSLRSDLLTAFFKPIFGDGMGGRERKV